MLSRLCYGLVFCIAAPALLVVWAATLDHKLPGLPIVRSPWVGGGVVAAGSVLLGRAMWDLWRRGGGLPMNAFPPPRFVASGAYRWVRHPIYVGFGLIVAGVALSAGSPAGVWVITPVTWLAMTALVVGYERIDLRRRFGPPPRIALSLPAPTPAPATSLDRLSAVLLAFLPWGVGYAAAARLTGAANQVDTMTAWERSWPTLEWPAMAYLGAYAWTALAPIVAREAVALRRFVLAAWWATAAGVWLFLVLPLAVQCRAVNPESTWGRLLQFDRNLDTSACALPSFHVVWAFLAAELWAQRLGGRCCRAIAWAIALSCLTTGVHSVADVLAGWGLAWAAIRYDTVWAACRRTTERLANSWRDWRIGPMRIINHGGYVALAAGMGLALVGLLLGPEYTAPVLVVALCALLGAGAWGQWLEASSQLSRPFGYFGGLFGGLLGVIVAQWVWSAGWMVAGAFAVAAPLIQALGRLRCLVQGCCHGRPVTTDWLGIRYRAPLSRVCKLARLDGIPVHATPLYSIIGNLAIFGLLVRAWFEHADMATLAGGYLVLSTCARFMEEGYRGEPQTVRWWGLPIYQWLAIGCLLGGITLTMLPAPVAPVLGVWSARPLVYAMPIGLLVWVAMGVDFPESNRRMSRLA